MIIKGWIITCQGSANILSHDWGTEFYHDWLDARIRVTELDMGCDHKFFTQRVDIVFK
jgi:hypothetical protein